MSDLIDRQAAIDTLDKHLRTTDVPVSYPGIISALTEWLNELPSAQPERLTDDDFETIRIHLNAYKEKLCNQQRWKEADEYQCILDRFISFASAQPVAKDINIPVKDCISRKAAIDAIMDADVCVTWNGVISDDDAVDIAIKSTKGSVISSIVNMPSAQPDMSEYSDKLWKKAYERGRAEAQAEIVRCKDCKHYKFADNRAFGFPVKRCEWTGFEDVDNDDFCSRAERRTDDCV